MGARNGLSSVKLLAAGSYEFVEDEAFLGLVLGLLVAVYISAWFVVRLQFGLVAVQCAAFQGIDIAYAGTLYALPPGLRRPHQLGVDAVTAGSPWDRTRHLAPSRSVRRRPASCFWLLSSV